MTLLYNSYLLSRRYWISCRNSSEMAVFYICLAIFRCSQKLSNFKPLFESNVVINRLILQYLFVNRLRQLCRTTEKFWTHLIGTFRSIYVWFNLLALNLGYCYFPIRVFRNAFNSALVIPLQVHVYNKWPLLETSHDNRSY